MKRTATCVCEQLSVTVAEDPSLVIMCCCIKCQQRSGSAFQLGTFYPHDERVTITGKEKTYSRIAESGRKMTLHFCPECGVSVYFKSDARPDMIGIHGGCFGDPDFPKPDRAVWVKEKYHWLQIPDGACVFEKNSV